MNFKNLYHRVFVFEADKGAGVGAAVVPPAGAQKTETTTETPKTVPLERFNEVNNQLKEIRQQLEARQKAEQEAEAQRLKEKEDWKTLAAKAEAELSSLKPQHEQAAQRASRYEEAIKGRLKVELADVPDHFKSLLAKLDPVEQLEWLSENRDKLKAPVSGVPATPKPTGSNLGAADKEKLQAQQAKIVRSSF